MEPIASARVSVKGVQAVPPFVVCHTPPQPGNEDIVRIRGVDGDAGLTAAVRAAACPQRRGADRVPGGRTDPRNIRLVRCRNGSGTTGWLEGLFLGSGRGIHRMSRLLLRRRRVLREGRSQS